MATLTTAVSRSGTSYIDATTGTILLDNGGGAGKMWTIAKCLLTNVDTTTPQSVYLYYVAHGTTPTTASANYSLNNAYKISAADGNGGWEDIRELAGKFIEDGYHLFAIAGTASKLKWDISYFIET